jgi:aspartate ammonia-lyase
VKGITANTEHLRRLVENSIGIVTALNPYLGYERTTALAKEAHETGKGVSELVLSKGWMTKEQLDEVLKPEILTHPRSMTAPPTKS